MNMLDKDEILRYTRQIMIQGIGEAGQRKLKDAEIVIVGVGGLGCSSATYLASAGVGRITIVDHDTVEPSDLNRQILYWEEDIGKRKVFEAQSKLSRLNPRARITPVFLEVREDNALDIIEGAHLVIDGTDNSATRLTLNSACVKLKIPFIYGGVSRLRGAVTTVIPGQTPCLACLRPEGAGKLGVFGAAAAVIANLQALEAIKIITGLGPSLVGKLLTFHGDTMECHVYEIRRDENCPVCSSAG